ncbi:hypothetical protein NHX12_007965, partial [Muraenolepis orangiensis]
CGGNKTDRRVCVLDFVYTTKLDSDEVQFGGHGRLDHATEFFTKPYEFNGCPNSMQVEAAEPSSGCCVIGRQGTGAPPYQPSAANGDADGGA